MTSLLLHVIGAFVSLVILDRLLKFSIPLEHLMLLSLATILPDLLDKSLTGSRYPFHSLLILGLILLSLNVIARYSVNIRPNFASKHPLFVRYLFLASIAIIIHPILDLEGFLPLFYPLDPRGYRLDFHISIIQKIPPVITDFNFGFIVEPFDYNITYDHESDLITTLDVLFGVIVSFTIIIKSLEKFSKHLEKRNT
jgi:hypothetical protein